MKKEKIESSHKVDQKINLTGYTSTSKDFDIAKNFAVKYLQKDDLPVIYSINFYGEKGLFELSPGYTAYPGEDEVLIQDGLEFLVTKVQYTTMEENEICIIELKYPAN